VTVTIRCSVVRARKPLRLPAVLTVHETKSLLDHLSGNGKGGKDRVTMLPEYVIPILHEHHLNVRVLHRRDLEHGWGRVQFPNAMERNRWENDQTGAEGRHHLDSSLVQKAVKTAVTTTGVTKRAGCRTEREEKHRLFDGVNTQRVADRAKHLRELIERDKKELSGIDQNATKLRHRIDRRKKSVVFALISLILVLGSVIAMQFVVPNWAWVEPVFFVVTPLSSLALLLLSAIGKTLKPVRLVERVTIRFARHTQEMLDEVESRMDVLGATIEKAELELNDLIV